MAEMPSAIGTDHLGADHAQTGIFFICDTSLDSLIKTRPSAGALEFGLAVKQFLTATCTKILPLFKVHIIFSGIGHLCSFFAQHAILLVREFVFPYFVRFFYSISFYLSIF